MSGGFARDKFLKIYDNKKDKFLANMDPSSGIEITATYRDEVWDDDCTVKLRIMPGGLWEFAE